MGRQTFNISLPPDMARQVERATKREQRSRSELVREALRIYLGGAYTPTAAERRAIEKGRAEIRRGEYITLEQLHAELDRLAVKERGKDASSRAKARARKAPSRAR